LKSANVVAVYVPALQDPDVNFKCFVLRGQGIPVADVRRSVESLGQERVGDIQTLDYITDRALLQERMTATLGGFFGGLALMLAAISLYGLMSYAVAQRQREIGIRVALGARPGRVLIEVVSDGLRVTLAGVCVGLAATLGTVQLVKSLLFGITPHDPWTLIAASVSLIAVALLACVFPAARAARVDPLSALRAE